MPARLAFPFFYRTITRHMDEDQRLEVDGILGDPAAERKLNDRKIAALAAAGIEVG